MHERADLIIVGAGTAGMPAAIAAAELGARVAVVDKADEVGGTLHLAAGQLSAAGTGRGRERGIADDPALHHADVMALSAGRANPELVRLAVEQAPLTVDWLIALGIDFERQCPDHNAGFGRYSRPRLYRSPGKARAILEAIRPEWERHVDSGQVTAYLGQELERPLLERGELAGVRTRDGLELRAPRVLLSSGSYDPIAARFCAALGAGVGAHEHDAFEERALVSPGVRPPRELHVNLRGERFHDEQDPDPVTLRGALLRQPRHAMWVVFDEAALAGGASFHTQLADAEAIRERARSERWMWCDEDLSQLAHRAGIDAHGLARSAASLATPPFYAAFCPPPLRREGRVRVDRQLRVLREDGHAIAGLYAAGEVLGTTATGGDARAGGMLLTPALSFGRLLGRRLAGAALSRNGR